MIKTETHFSVTGLSDYRLSLTIGYGIWPGTQDRALTLVPATGDNLPTGNFFWLNLTKYTNGAIAVFFL